MFHGDEGAWGDRDAGGSDKRVRLYLAILCALGGHPGGPCHWSVPMHVGASSQGLEDRVEKI